MNRMIALAGVMLVTTGLLAGCSGRHDESRPAQPPVVTGSQMETVQQSSIPELVTAIGTVRAATSAVVAARIPGAVASLLVAEGTAVKRGQLLLTLQAQETEAGAAGATAAVLEAERALDEARSRLKLAESTFARYEKLLAEQAVTRQEFEVRQHEQEAARQGVARSEARLTQAREGASAAQTMAGYSRVAAPIAGIVTSKQANLGASVFPGMPLVTIEQGGDFRLELAAPESLLGSVRIGQQVMTEIDGAAGRQTGRVVEIVPQVDPATRTFNVKVAITGTGLRSGQYGRGSFSVGSAPGIALPLAAVREKGALTAVWTVDAAQTARLRIVKTGRQLGERIEIVSGLSAGERVIVGGTWPTTEGARIE